MFHMLLQGQSQTLLPRKLAMRNAVIAAATGSAKAELSERATAVFGNGENPAAIPGGKRRVPRKKAVQSGCGMDSASGAVHRKGPVNQRFAATPGHPDKRLSLGATPAALPYIAREIRRAGRGSHRRGIAFASCL